MQRTYHFASDHGVHLGGGQVQEGAVGQGACRMQDACDRWDSGQGCRQGCDCAGLGEVAGDRVDLCAGAAQVGEFGCDCGGGRLAADEHEAADPTRGQPHRGRKAQP